MTLNDLRFSSLRAVSSVLALVMTACTATVVGGADPSQGHTSSEGTGGTPETSASTGASDPGCDDCEPPPAPPPPAIAITAAQLGYSSCNGTTGSGGTGGGGTTVGGGCGGVDPTTVYLELGNPAPTCGAPQPSVACGPGYTVSIGVPASELVPGVIQLSDASLISTFSESGPNDTQDPSVCPFGGGSFATGTLTIVGVDTNSITFTLSGTQSFDFTSGNADGTYVAQRCQ